MTRAGDKPPRYRRLVRQRYLARRVPTPAGRVPVRRPSPVLSPGVLEALHSQRAKSALPTCLERCYPCTGSLTAVVAKRPGAPAFRPHRQCTGRRLYLSTSDGKVMCMAGGR